MTVESRTRTINHVGTGSETTFSYNFLVYESEHMTVRLDGVTQPSGNYTVTGLGEPAGGTVVFNTAPGNGVRIDLLRIVPLTQLTDYRRYDPFPSETHEKGLDLQTMAAQQIEDTQIIGLRYSLPDLGNVEDANVELPLLANMHGNFLFWEAPSAQYPNGRLIPVNSSPGGGLVTTEFTQDWLTSSTAAIGRSKLDAASLGSNNTWRGAQYFDMTSGNAYIQMTSPNAQSMFDQYSGTGTADKRRSRLRQSGNFGAIVGLTDGQVVKHKVMEWNDVGAVRFGAAGGAEGLAGWVNCEELQVDGRSLVNGAYGGYFAPTNNTITIPDVLDTTAQDTRYRAVKIYLPKVRMAATNAYLRATLLNASQQEEVGAVYHHTWETATDQGNSPGGGWAGNFINMVPGAVFDTTSPGTDLTIWISHIDQGVKLIRWTFHGKASGVNRWTRLIGYGQMGIDTDTYTGLKITSDQNFLDLGAFVTYQRTL